MSESGDTSGRWGGRSLATMVVWALLVAVAAIGCNDQPATTWNDPGPAGTFERFLMQWFKGEQGSAYEMIHPDDRAVLTESLDYVEERLGSGVLAPREMLVAGRVDNPYDLEDIDPEPELERKPEKGTKVTLDLVYHDGRSGEAAVIWGGDRWYVDLPLEASKERAAGGEDGAGDSGQTDESAKEDPNTEPESETPDATSGDSRE